MNHLVFIKPGAPVDECSIELEHHFDGFINTPINETHHKKITTYVQDSSGTIMGGILAEIGNQNLSIQGIWVNGAERGQGVGNKLLTLLEDYTLEKQLEKITFETAHLRLVEFFVHSGYEIVSTVVNKNLDCEQYTVEKSITYSPSHKHSFDNTTVESTV